MAADGVLGLAYQEYVSYRMQKSGGQEPTPLAQARLALCAEMKRALNKPGCFQRLERAGVIKSMVADGACMFRGVSEQLYGSQSRHQELREEAVQMATHEKYACPQGWLGEMRTQSEAVCTTQQERDDVKVLYSIDNPHPLALQEYTEYMGEPSTFSSEDELKALCVAHHIAMHVFTNRYAGEGYTDHYYCDPRQVDMITDGSDDAIPHVWLVWRHEHYWAFYADAPATPRDAAACGEALELATAKVLAEEAGKRPPTASAAASDGARTPTPWTLPNPLEICYGTPEGCDMGLLAEIAAWSRLDF